MADFALWATACETVLWPAGTFMRAYDENRRVAIEGVIEADPVADHVREMMAKVIRWTGSASDLYRIGADASRDKGSTGCVGWPKSPRALAGRLRRAQTSLRTLGIEIAFSREGREGTRIIRMSASHENPKHRQYRRHRQYRQQRPACPIRKSAAVCGRFVKRGDDADDADGADAKSRQLGQAVK
jgi:hypothetical protein